MHYDASAPALWRVLCCLRANWLPCLLVPQSKVELVQDMARWLRTADGCSMPSVCVQPWPPRASENFSSTNIPDFSVLFPRAPHVITEQEVPAENAFPYLSIYAAVVALAGWQEDQQDLHKRDRILVNDDCSLWRWVWPCDPSQLSGDEGACLTEMIWACEQCAACQPHIEAWLSIHDDELAGWDGAGHLVSSSLHPCAKRQRCA